MRRQPAIEALEEKHGEDFLTLCRRCAKQGMSRREAAEVLGIAYPTFRHACRRVEGVDWPGRNSGRRRKQSRRSIGEKIRRAMIRSGRCVTVEFQGRARTLAEIGRLIGVSQHEMWHRYHVQGLRGDDLAAPAHPTQGRVPAEYVVGYSLADWQTILDYAAQRGSQAAAKKFDVPLGAVHAAQREQWEKVA